MDSGRRDRTGASGARLDESSARLLAAGHSAAAAGFGAAAGRDVIRHILESGSRESYAGRGHGFGIRCQPVCAGTCISDRCRKTSRIIRSITRSTGAVGSNSASGALGDMGAHLIDHPFWALGLTHPTSIEATSTPWGTTPVPADPNAPPGSPASRNRSRPVSYPMATTVHYEFGARGSMPPVKLSWTDGGLYPPRPDVLPDDVVLEAEGGVIFIGEKGILINDTYGAKPRCYPQALMEKALLVPQSMPRILWSHELNFAKAIRGEAKASSPFEYSAQLTETMLLGVAALRSGQGRKLAYDAEKAEFVNAPDANQYLTREYRAGWAI